MVNHRLAVINIRILPEDKSILERVAHDQGFSLSELCRNVLYSGVAALEEAADIRSRRAVREMMKKSRDTVHRIADGQADH